MFNFLAFQFPTLTDTDTDTDIGTDALSLGHKQLPLAMRLDAQMRMMLGQLVSNCITDNAVDAMSMSVSVRLHTSSCYMPRPGHLGSASFVLFVYLPEQAAISRVTSVKYISHTHTSIYLCVHM